MSAELDLKTKSLVWYSYKIKHTMFNKWYLSKGIENIHPVNDVMAALYVIVKTETTKMSLVSEWINYS